MKITITLLEKELLDTVHIKKRKYRRVPNEIYGFVSYSGLLETVSHRDLAKEVI